MTGVYRDEFLLVEQFFVGWKWGNCWPITANYGDFAGWVKRWLKPPIILECYRVEIYDNGKKTILMKKVTVKDISDTKVDCIKLLYVLFSDPWEGLVAISTLSRPRTS